MKILKLFDNFQTDDYYLKIDTFKYQDLLGDDWKREQRVSKEVIDKLKSIYGKRGTRLEDILIF